MREYNAHLKYSANVGEFDPRAIRDPAEVIAYHLKRETSISNMQKEYPDSYLLRVYIVRPGAPGIEEYVLPTADNGNLADFIITYGRELGPDGESPLILVQCLGEVETMTCGTQLLFCQDTPFIRDIRDILAAKLAHKVHINVPISLTVDEYVDCVPGTRREDSIHWREGMPENVPVAENVYLRFCRHKRDFDVGAHTDEILAAEQLLEGAVDAGQAYHGYVLSDRACMFRQRTAFEYVLEGSAQNIMRFINCYGDVMTYEGWRVSILITDERNKPVVLAHKDPWKSILYSVRPDINNTALAEHTGLPASAWLPELKE